MLQTNTASQALRDPCERYRARVEAHLPTLPDDKARLAFLKAEHAKWVQRFQNFVERSETGSSDETACAFDFHITMADLNILMTRCIGAKAAA